MAPLKNLFRLDSISVGLAMFTMFFGAGNIIFPLSVGQFAGDKNFFAIAGLILSAAIIPIAGVIAMILFDGDYRQFFGRLGKIPGFVLALIVISLLGPLGSTPRCIALSYTTLSGSFWNINPILFSGLCCGLIFVCAVKKRHLLTLLGWVLTPVLLLSLLAIIAIGIFSTPNMQSVEHSKWTVFLHGLKEGYNTMDLLAAFFFSSTILNILKSKEKTKPNAYLSTALSASLIGALLLALVYIGFSYLASLHAGSLSVSSPDQLLAAIVLKVAGAKAGWLVCLTIALACLTTAIALIAAFTDFFQKEVLKEKISYEKTLIGALIVTFIVSTFKFAGISAFLGPILEICYPGLIVLTILNIAHRLKSFQPIKTPVFSVFVLTAISYVL